MKCMFKVQQTLEESQYKKEEKEEKKNLEEKISEERGNLLDQKEAWLKKKNLWESLGGSVG